MFKSLILFSSFIGSIYCLQLTANSFTECDPKPSPAIIQSIDITPCTSEPCAFTRGTVVSVKGDFNPHYSANNCRLEMKALIGDWIPISDEDVCGQYLTCPIASGTVNTLDYRVQVDNMLPQGDRLTRWRLLCDNGATEAFCADISIVIN